MEALERGNLPSVDRRPVDRPATEADFAAAQKGTFEMTETAEQPVVAKQARVVEEVAVGKEASERTETVHETVRRTDVEVEKVGAGQAGSFSNTAEEEESGDTRGILEKIADTITGDDTDDKTGRKVA